MTILRFYNAHIVDPSQSIDSIGYIDIVDGKISDLQLGTPAKNDALDKFTDCKARCWLRTGRYAGAIGRSGAEHQSHHLLSAAAGRHYRTSLLAKYKTGD